MLWRVSALAFAAASSAVVGFSAFQLRAEVAQRPHGVLFRLLADRPVSLMDVRAPSFIKIPPYMENVYECAETNCALSRFNSSARDDLEASVVHAACLAQPQHIRVVSFGGGGLFQELVLGVKLLRVLGPQLQRLDFVVVDPAAPSRGEAHVAVLDEACRVLGDAAAAAAADTTASGNAGAVRVSMHVVHTCEEVSAAPADEVWTAALAVDVSSHLLGGAARTVLHPDFVNLALRIEPQFWAVAALQWSSDAVAATLFHEREALLASAALPLWLAEPAVHVAGERQARRIAKYGLVQRLRLLAYNALYLDLICAVRPCLASHLA